MKKNNQKIYYDKKTDVVWISVQAGEEELHKEVAPGISVEINKKGELLGIEILNASKVLGKKLGFGNQSKPLSLASYHKIR